MKFVLLQVLIHGKDYATNNETVLIQKILAHKGYSFLSCHISKAHNGIDENPFFSSICQPTTYKSIFLADKGLVVF
jgi:hypothetical protein